MIKMIKKPYPALTQSIVDLSCDLIARASVTPDDKGCQLILADLLKQAGFIVTELHFEDTHNLWATHTGQGSVEPVICLAGHTDVVPPGDLRDWEHPPFEPVIKNGCLYGRGAADMKSSLAVQIISAIEFVKKNPLHKGTLSFLITSDEEGNAKNGTQKVLNYLFEKNPNLKIHYAIIGEPSSVEKLGDMIKIGRRGSLSGILSVQGIQGHVAYPQRALNPFHLAAGALADLIQYEFDKGNENFPPTSLQFTELNFGVGADNVIPGNLTAKFNLRYSPMQTEENIKQIVTQIFFQNNLTSSQYHINWRLSGLPFYTPKNSKIISAVVSSIKKITGLTSELSTSGGTSDGRFFALYGTEVVELGPKNETIHKINEHVNIDDLTQLQQIYEHIFNALLLAH